jgi:hypothetical protein
MDWWIDGLVDYWIDGLVDYWIDGLVDDSNSIFSLSLREITGSRT